LVCCSIRGKSSTCRRRSALERRNRRSIQRTRRSRDLACVHWPSARRFLPFLRTSQKRRRSPGAHFVPGGRAHGQVAAGRASPVEPLISVRQRPRSFELEGPSTFLGATSSTQISARRQSDETLESTSESVVDVPAGFCRSIRCGCPRQSSVLADATRSECGGAVWPTATVAGPQSLLGLDIARGP
jgi:hypothetical protein